MTQYNRHKKAVRIFRDITSNPEKYLIIHYSCESFIDKEDGRTPRITTIAIRYFESSQTKTFSIHEVAEQKNVAIDKIEENYDLLELGSVHISTSTMRAKKTKAKKIISSLS